MKFASFLRWGGGLHILSWETPTAPNVDMQLKITVHISYTTFVDPQESCVNLGWSEHPLRTKAIYFIYSYRIYILYW